MAEFVYTVFNAVFGTSLFQDVSEFLSSLLTALNTLFADKGAIKEGIGILSVIAASLMTIYLFMDVMSKMQMEMLTLEKLCMIFIKYLIGMLLLIYITDIISTLFGLASGIYEYVGEAYEVKIESQSFSMFGIDDWMNPDKKKDVIDALKGKFKGNPVKALANNISMIFHLILPFLISKLAKYAALFFAGSNAIKLVARALFAPIGVVQCFEEGQRSAGIKYLKLFTAEALSFAIIFACLYASNLIQTSMLNPVIDSIGNIESLEQINKLLGGTEIITITVLQLAVVGGMAASGQLAKEVVGA